MSSCDHIVRYVNVIMLLVTCALMTQGAPWDGSVLAVRSDASAPKTYLAITLQESADVLLVGQHRLVSSVSTIMTVFVLLNDFLWFPLEVET